MKSETEREPGAMDKDETEPVVIEEVVTLDTEETEARFARSEFATVVFHNIAETYPEDAPIQCSYTVTADLIPTTRDYVALYKVGWMSPRDYIYYEWAPIPREYKQGTDADASVMFPAHKLPKDDGEFYQFCYVSSASQIKGASTPFQFRKPGADDFVEVEDEETNMLVIRSKTLYLEENLQKAEFQKQKLVETQEALQKERDGIILKYQEVKSRLASLEKENSKLKGQLSSSEAMVQQQKNEAKDLVTVRDELEEKLSKLKKEREALNISIPKLTSDIETQNNTIKGLRAELTTVRAEMRKLQSEKDALEGKSSALQEEVELYKKHYETAELNMDQYSKNSENLNIQLAQQESLIDHLRHSVDTLTNELEDNRQNLDKQTAINLQDKDLLKDLEERLRNTEDKLMAAEESKLMLQKEITAFEVTQHEMSRNIEKSRSECVDLKQKLCRLEEDFTQKTQIQAEELEQTLNDLQASVQEKEQLQKENIHLKQELDMTLEKTVEGHGSRSIMQQSLSQIKSRLEKKEKLCISLEKKMKGRDQDFIERERELRREIEDLKEKIYMCGEEYKLLYVENSKLKKKLDRSKKKTRSEKSGRKSESEEAEVTRTETEVPLTQSSLSLSQDIENHMDQFQREHEKKLMKKEKYKKMVKEEQEKNEKLMKQLDEEKCKKDGEIARLKKRIQDIPNEWDLRLRALEKCVTEKEMIIDDLNKKLLEATQGRKDETGVTPSRSAPVQMENKFVWPAAMHNIGPQGYPYPPANSPWRPNIYPCYSQVPYPFSSNMPGAMMQPCPPPPLVYPHPQGPPVPPRNWALSKDQNKEDSRGEDMMDKVDGPAVAPLQPLPAPLEPEKLPSAKLASAKSSTGGGDMVGDFVDADGIVEQLKVSMPQEQRSAEHHVLEFVGTDNDRFYDAEGSAMKICEECNKTFPADVDEEVFAEHQMSHFGTLCPICKMFKPDNMTDDDFERHVNKHYEDEDNNKNWY